MKYPHIISEISNHQWAITNGAMAGILKAVEDGIHETDRVLFHTASEDMRAQIFGAIRDDGENDYARIVGDIGIISIDGPIVPRSRSFTKVSGLNSISALTETFKSMERNKSVNKILMLFDSPGGAVTGVSEFAKLVSASQKETISYVYGTAASAAYWIASAADKMYASDTGIVGSIGTVVSIRKNTDDSMIEIVSSQSPNKRPELESKEGINEIRKTLDGIADVFIDSVAENRDVSRSTVLNDFGRGGVLVASKALEAGMIDGVMTFDNIISGINNKNSSDRQAVQAQMDGYHKKIANNDQQKRSTKMLDELLRDNPEAAAEYNQRIEAAKKEGKSVVEARISKVKTVLSSDYPEKMKNLAMQMLDGEVSTEALDVAMTVFDSIKAEKTINTAIEDSAQVGDVKTQDIKPVDVTEAVETEEQYQAMLNGLGGRA